MSWSANLASLFLQPVMDAQLRRLLQPQGIPSMDFGQPPGEAALVPASSASWRVFKNPVTVFIGGVAAVILELAEPAVRAGVWTHSSFRTDPLRRLQRTGLAAMVTVYGPASQARRMIDGVVRMHSRVTGITEHGEAYAANEEVLLNWVQATASWGFVQAYSRYARHLDNGTLTQLYGEALPAARLYGALGAPATVEQMQSLFDQMVPRLEASPVIIEFLEILERAPILPMPARPLQRLLIRAATSLVPASLRQQLGLGHRWELGPLQMRLVTMAARLADRTVLPSSPAVQSCLRMGLPRDALYTDHHTRQRDSHRET